MFVMQVRQTDSKKKKTASCLIHAAATSNTRHHWCRHEAHSGTLMTDGIITRQTATFTAAPDGPAAAPFPWQRPE